MIDGQKVRRISSVTRDSLETEVCLLSSAAVGLWLQDGWSIRTGVWRKECTKEETPSYSIADTLSIILLGPSFLVYSPIEGNRQGQEPLEIRVIQTRIQWETIMNTFQRLVVKDLLSQIISKREIQYLASLHKILGCLQQSSFPYMGYYKC